MVDARRAADFSHAKTARYLYEARLRLLLTRELGVKWGPVRDGIADVDGVPAGMLRAFSRRRADMAVLAYAGLRPQEALALEWRHVRERTLLIERAVSDGQLKALKNRRQPRTIPLLAPLREDLAESRRASGAPASSSPVFPATSGGFWRPSAWRNWRKRIYRPVAESVGLSGARPYDLRHAFASLLIHEGRLSVGEDRRAARAQPDRLPGHLRARDGRRARRRTRRRRGADRARARQPRCRRDRRRAADVDGLTP